MEAPDGSRPPPDGGRPRQSSTTSLRRPVAHSSARGAPDTLLRRAPRHQQPPRLTPPLAPPPLPSLPPATLTIGDEDGPMSILHYPPSCAPRGLLLLAPGSRGGMGPGQAAATLGKFDSSLRTVYTALSHRMRAAHGLAVCHLNWRACPTRKGAPPGTLKAAATLRAAAKDPCRAGGRRALLPAGAGRGGGGRRRGGGEEAAIHPQDLGPLAGVVSLSGGLRVAVDGSAHFIEIGDRLRGGASRSRPKEYAGCDSESCVQSLARASVPLLLTHGLADTTVDPEASRAIFNAATGPKGILWLKGADHHYRTRSAVLLDSLSQWVPELIDIKASSSVLDRRVETGGESHVGAARDPQAAITKLPCRANEALPELASLLDQGFSLTL
ncbi:hypothetical protein AB1Y20_003375 [Prymnesium parvum]|uniref:Peptidase S9 prolyl oligopeptidase catalytic domain-containing protein n=1 Tax=Prymnesium parvum TaxID=97485 RepID=A0AB34JBQ9_PRYPA